jgi:hypothetical protein
MTHTTVFRSVAAAFSLALCSSALSTAACAQSAPAPASAPAAAPAIVQGTEDAPTTQAAKKILEGLRKGSFDRTLFSDSMNKQVSDEMLTRATREFSQMDPPEWTYLGHTDAAADSARQVYRLKFKDYALILQAHLDASGKMDTFAVKPDTAKR